jgi:hypothetical protein
MKYTNLSTILLCITYESVILSCIATKTFSFAISFFKSVLMHYKVFRLYDAKFNIKCQVQSYSKIMRLKSLLDVKLHDCKITQIVASAKMKICKLLSHKTTYSVLNDRHHTNTTTDVPDKETRVEASISDKWT